MSEEDEDEDEDEDGDSGGEGGVPVVPGAAVSSRLPFPVHDPLDLTGTPGSFAVTRSLGSRGTPGSPPLSPAGPLVERPRPDPGPQPLASPHGDGRARVGVVAGGVTPDLDATSSFAVDSFMADVGLSSTSAPSTGLLRSRPPPTFTPQASLAEVGGRVRGCARAAASGRS
jgi:hypothetical protein